MIFEESLEFMLAMEGSIFEIHEFSDCFLFFFFQAEDSIRVRGVTGVQTCALPICPNHLPKVPRPDARALRGGRTDREWVRRAAPPLLGELQRPLLAPLALAEWVDLLSS